jgi:transcriptional regulator with XRE-family HTH domain
VYQLQKKCSYKDLAMNQIFFKKKIKKYYSNARIFFFVKLYGAWVFKSLRLCYNSSERRRNMDNIKTGQFIKECRKEKKLTQQQVAESLGISFKTVSKWECGNGAPDVSLMLPLCELLEINVNELLTGSHISNEDYKMNAEKNLMNVLEEKKKTRKKLLLCLLWA